MNKAMVRIGDTVLIDYTIRLQDGTIAGSTLENEPIQFKVGNGEIIPGLENSVIGMYEGDSKTVSLSCDDAYGPRMDDLIQELERNMFPQSQKLTVGQTLELQTEDETLSATIIEISANKVKVDTNHFLAGKDIVVEYKILEII